MGIDSMIVLEGRLEVFPLPDVLRMVSSGGLTGTLRVAGEGGSAAIHLLNGEVYLGLAGAPEGLGERLVDAGLITRTQLWWILDERQRAGGGRLGDLLVEKGILPRGALEPFAEEALAETISVMLLMDRGTFAFDQGEAPAEELGRSIPVGDLIREWSRRVEAWEAIRRRIPSTSAVLRMVPAPLGARRGIGLEPDEWRVLTLVDGRRSVAEIAAAGGRSEVETCKALFGLVASGLLEVVAGSAEAADAPAGILRLEEGAPGQDPAGAREPAAAPLPGGPEPRPNACRSAGEPAEPGASPDRPESPGGKAGDQGISREGLLRLIRGVRGS